MVSKTSAAATRSLLAWLPLGLVRNDKGKVCKGEGIFNFRQFVSFCGGFEGGMRPSRALLEDTANITSAVKDDNDLKRRRIGPVNNGVVGIGN